MPALPEPKPWPLHQLFSECFFNQQRLIARKPRFNAGVFAVLYKNIVLCCD
jgi:hypothetical protein